MQKRLLHPAELGSSLRIRRRSEPGSPNLEITVPLGHFQKTPKKPECGIYEFGPRKNIFPPSKEIKRGDWKTESSSSSTSSSSNRSSTRSLLSVSSGTDGDNEGGQKESGFEIPEVIEKG
ncbi:UNVERIFIED_CONTAM: hypothetical protein K2H54_004158 [Gekko kuhli]